MAACGASVASVQAPIRGPLWESLSHCALRLLSTQCKSINTWAWLKTFVIHFLLPNRHGCAAGPAVAVEAPWLPLSRRPAAALSPPTTAMAATRGYAQVLSQSLVHAGWHSEDSEPRKGFHTSWVDDGVSVGGMRFNDQSGRIDSLRQRSADLRQVMEPQHRHVAMDEITLERMVDLWEEKWPPSLRKRFRL